MIYRRRYPRRLGPMIATQPAHRVTPRSLGARPPVDPEPKRVSPETVRTPVVGSPRPCPVCGETELQGRQTVLGQLPPGTDPPAGDGGAASPRPGDSGALRGGAEEATGGGTMNRRLFISAMTGGLLAAPLAAEAQPTEKVYRIGFHGNSTEALEANLVGLFREGLRERSYVDERREALVRSVGRAVLDSEIPAARGPRGQPHDHDDPPRHGCGRRPDRHGLGQEPRAAWRELDRVGVDRAGPGGKAPGAPHADRTPKLSSVAFLANPACPWSNRRGSK